MSIWTPLVYIWQDALLAVFFAALESFIPRKRILSVLYGALAVYVALNVPLVLALGSPLTSQMSQAAGGALWDSIRHYITIENILRVTAVLASAIGLPLLVRHWPRKLNHWTFGAFVVAAVAGAIGSRKLDTDGLHRNAIVAYVSSWKTKTSANDHPVIDWRKSPFGAERREGLEALKGTARGRNVVMVSLESTGAGYLTGSTNTPMPYFSRVSQQGISFANAYSVYPESIKGLFSVLCSRYPSLDTKGEDYQKVRSPALAKVLADAGYRTGLFHSGRFMYLGMEEVVKDRGYQVCEDAGAISGVLRSSFGVDEEAALKRMLAWVDSIPKNQSFFLTYLPIAGHHPYESPPPHLFPGQTEKERYLNALGYVDRSLASLIQGLESRGLASNTLFVVYGDHGEAFGQHEANFGHTLFIYEENVHVPLALFGEGLRWPSQRIERAASLLDLAPTVLDLLGISAPTEFQGHSLLQPEERMALFFTDYSLGLLGLRDGPWKFIYEIDGHKSKLFNLQNDPAEATNRATEFPDRVNRYKDLLQQWSSTQKAQIKSNP